MDMIKIAMIGLAAALLAMQVKAGRPEYEIFITMAACLCIFFFLITKLTIVIDAVSQIQEYIRLDSKYVAILLKMIGITYVAEFSSNLCRDAGYGAVAGQIEMFGKLSVLVISMPVLLALLETISQFLS
ncbi:MAG: stage III sporulation protein AD [Lachnospiraceae bacterium]|jgi:stage III sporulation protein AD|nr:stage III sporulation protein AD [Lachnospiraceae bacterium]